MCNKSGATICCGYISIETGTLVVAFVLCVLYMLITSYLVFSQHQILEGVLTGIFACACFLVIYGQHARNQWVFLPCLILGLVIVGFLVYEFYTNVTCLAGGNESFKEFLSSPKGCARGLLIYVVFSAVSGWLYSIILRGFLAVRKG